MMIKKSFISKWQIFCPAWALIHYKDAILPNRKSHCGGKMILQQFYLQNEITYTGQMAFYIESGTRTQYFEEVIWLNFLEIYNTN